jgi:FAD/FMN-containing dehydrogenase
MQTHGWGRYPVIDSKAKTLEAADLWRSPFIPTGNFRSYADAALYQHHLPMKPHQLMSNFDGETGLLTCDAGVLLSDIVATFLPRGWFLSITPGTSQITVGGAVAADVHGKNHHIRGCFSTCVESLTLLWPDNQEINCSATQHPDIFSATCGGMGLTGIITQVSFYLKKVSSQWINQLSVKTLNLRDTFVAFEKYKSVEYSVAWIDCLAKGNQLGRSLVMLGEFYQNRDLQYRPPSTVSVPFTLPSFTLNSLSVKVFNELYYFKQRKTLAFTKTSVQTFFYPLDSIHQWNRIYGPNGFIQFQFILPKAASFEGMQSILTQISATGFASFLAVLKLYGPHNDNWLSFPIEGYSLALDFKMTKALPAFINGLTDQVVALGGRIYLAKDALMTQSQFEASYPNIPQFKTFRTEHCLDQHFTSQQAIRLGL